MTTALFLACSDATTLIMESIEAVCHSMSKIWSNAYTVNGIVEMFARNSVFVDYSRAQPRV